MIYTSELGDFFTRPRSRFDLFTTKNSAFLRFWNVSYSIFAVKIEKQTSANFDSKYWITHVPKVRRGWIFFCKEFKPLFRSCRKITQFAFIGQEFYGFINGSSVSIYPVYCLQITNSSSPESLTALESVWNVIIGKINPSKHVEISSRWSILAYVLVTP